MKKVVFLLITALFAFSTNANGLNSYTSRADEVETPDISDSDSDDLAEPKLVIEGRIFWYICPYLGASGIFGKYVSNQFGVQIGKEVEIDGVKWHEVNVVLSDSYDRYDTEKVYDSSVRRVAYIREENGYVYSYLPEEDLKNYPRIFDEVVCAIDYPKYNHMFNLYYFGEEGDKFPFGSKDSKIELTISKKEVITNSGYEYNRYHLNGDFYWENDLYLVEGVGREGRYPYMSGCSALFFAPLRPFVATTPRYDPPALCYVTDSEYNILYAVEDSPKLWEQYLSQMEITVDSEKSEQWYNLQGIEIERPTAPGIYLHRKGNTTTKIRF